VSHQTRFQLLACALAASFLVLSCTSEEVLMVAVSSVEVSPRNVNAVQGDEVQLTATVLDDESVEVPAAEVLWRSDDATIASVDETGVLVAHSPGTVLVHASFEGVSGSATVVVHSGPFIATARDSVVIYSGVAGTPEAATVSVTNGGTGSLGALSATIEYPSGTPRQWLQAELSRTSVPATLTLRATTTGLLTGSYLAYVTLRAAGNPIEKRVAVVLQLTGFLLTENGGGSSVTEAGGTDAVFVVLTSRPSSNVVFDIRSSDPTEVLLSRSFLTFTPANWNTSQSVTLLGVDDQEDDGDQTSTVTVMVNDGLSDDVFEDLSDQSVIVTTVDNDGPPPRVTGFSVTQSGGSTRVTEAGGTDNISVALTAAPTSNVVLVAVSADLGEATVSPASLTFTPGNWNVAQSFVVTGVDDAVDDGDLSTNVTVSVDDAASEDGFDALPDQTVTVTTVDDDAALPAAGMTVTQSGGSTLVTEAGASDSVTVVLTSPPTSNVVVDITSARTTEATVSPASLTFTPANWNVPQTFVVTGVNDTADDGDQSTTVRVQVNDDASDDRYDSVTDRTFAATTTDDDDPPPPSGFAVTESDGNTRVAEAGGVDTVTVVLTSAPILNVVFEITSANTAEARVSPALLTFNSANWNVPQRFIVTGVNETADDGDQTTIVTISVNDAASDDRFDPLPDQTITATTVDDDDPPPPPAGMTVTQSGGSTVATEAGGTDSITVVLTSPPASNVVVDATSADAAEATVSPASLTFTPASWNVPQRFVVTAVDETADDGDQTTTVTISVNDAASDDRFDPLPAQTVTATTVDDDDPPPPPAGMTVTQSGGSTVVTEAGGTDSVTVVLTSPPASNVVVDATSADAAEATVSPASLTFTPASWNVPQRFVFTAVDETADDGDQTTTVTISVDDAASDDRFDPLPDQTVTVTTVDDDDPPPPPAGMTVTQSGGSTIVTEAGGADSVSVVLTSPPTSAVMLGVASGNAAEATVSPASLTFTPAGWNVPQLVTVAGVDDAVDDGDQQTTLTISVNDAASDDRYDPLADATVSATNVDNDPA
jgi:hypothetical protein